MIVSTLSAQTAQAASVSSSTWFRSPLLRGADLSKRHCVTLGQPLTVSCTSGEGRTLPQPDNVSRQRSVSPAAQILVFTFQFLDPALSLSQLCAGLFCFGIEPRLLPVVGFSQNGQTDQLAIFLRQFLRFAFQRRELRFDGVAGTVKPPRLPAQRRWFSNLTSVELQALPVPTLKANDTTAS